MKVEVAVLGSPSLTVRTSSPESSVLGRHLKLLLGVTHRNATGSKVAASGGLYDPGLRFVDLETCFR